MCEGKVHSGLSMKCDSSAEVWSFLPADDVIVKEVLRQGRNFFRPIELVDRSSPARSEISPLNDKAFFSETWWDDAVIQSRLDGRIWLMRHDSQATALDLKWGDDMVAMDEGCGRGSASFATVSADCAATDVLQAY